jgi:hypothetical protein
MGARDAKVTPYSRNVRWGSLPPTAPTKSRSTLCVPPHETSKDTRKPDNVAASQHRSASHMIAARRSMRPRLWGMLDGCVVAFRRRGVALPPPMVVADSWFSDSKLMRHVATTHEGTFLVEGKSTYTFELPDGR